MSQQLINRNSDLKRLRDEGYDVEVRSNHLLVKQVPYVNSIKEIKFGILVSELNVAGDMTTTPKDHTVYFSGEHPCDKNGVAMTKIINQSVQKSLGHDLIVHHYFSSKPSSGCYKDHYEKMATYVAIISSPAHSIDPSVTANTLAAGHILVNKGLLSSIESEEELEGILVHEIAHVEKRHVLKQYYALLNQQAANDMIAAMATGIAGAAARDGNRDVAAIAVGISVAARVAVDIFYKGYPVEQEREADELAILYFDQNNMDKQILENVFKKLKFYSLATVDNPDPASNSHPLLEERIARVKQTKFKKFNNEHFLYKGHPSQPPVQIDLLYQSTFNDTSNIFFYINDYSFFDKYQSKEAEKIYLTLEDDNGKQKYALSLLDQVRDMWGVYLVLNINNATTIKNLNNISIIIETKDEDMMRNKMEVIDFSKGSIDYECHIEAEKKGGHCLCIH
ncbi:MAG: M48 family metalloprotease [Nitrospirae bacterium]|nr:M48 family metalloprotease [Nitrospirota bacterium]